MMENKNKHEVLYTPQNVPSPSGKGRVGAIPRRLRFWRRLLYVLGILLLLLIIGIIYILKVSDIDAPVLKEESNLHVQRTEQSKGFYTLKDNCSMITVAPAMVCKCVSDSDILV